MKKIYLVHCWSGTGNDGWYPWLKKQVSNNEVELITFDMPNPDEPTINEWVSKLNEIVTSLDSNTYFIGHSIGCQTIMRYLATKEIVTIGGILFVAPWLNLLADELEEEDKELAYEWLNIPIDFNKIKNFTNNINCIFSDDDYFVPTSDEQEFKDKLNAKTVMLIGKGHLCQIDGIYEEPEIFIQTTKMLNIEKSDIDV